MTCRDWFGDAGDEHLFETEQEPEPSFQAAMKAIQACYDRAMETCGEQARRINDLRKDLATMTTRAGEVATTCLELRHDNLLAHKTLEAQARTIANLRGELDRRAATAIDRNPSTGMPRAAVTEEPYQELDEDHDAGEDYPEAKPTFMPPDCPITKPEDKRTVGGHHLTTDQYRAYEQWYYTGQFGAWITSLEPNFEDAPEDSEPGFEPTPSECDECFYGPASECNQECDSCLDGQDVPRGGCMGDPDPESFLISRPGPYGSLIWETVTQKDLEDQFYDWHGFESQDGDEM